MSLIRDRYQHLYEIERKRIPPTPSGDLRLHRLERPCPWPDYVWPQRDHIERYPDYPPLIKRIAHFVGVGESQVVLGQGIEDLIRTLVLLCCDPGDGFAFTWPTCAMFELYARIFNVTPQPIVTDPDCPPDAERIASYAGESKLLLLPNPGQPVETCYTLEELRLIAHVCRTYDTVFAIDEAYYGFGAPTGLSLIEDFDNVVILRTFSKAFGAAGIRVGYAIGQHAIIQPLDAIRTSGEISGLSLRSAARLLALYPTVIELGINEVMQGRNWLVNNLRNAGFKATGHWANHVLITMPSKYSARQMVAKLKERGIHVKGDYPEPLERHILVTAGPLGMMQRFMAAFLDCQAQAA